MSTEVKTQGYDKREIFEKEVLPLRNAFMKTCALYDIPTFVTSAIADLEDGTTEYSSDMISAITREIPLNEEKISKMANVLNGFDVVEHQSIVEIEL